MSLRTEYGVIAKKYFPMDEAFPGMPLFRLSPPEQEAYMRLSFSREAMVEIEAKRREAEIQARLARQRRIVAVYNYQIEQKLWVPRIGTAHACMDWLPGDPPLPDGQPIGRLEFVTSSALDNAMSGVRVGVVLFQGYEADMALNGVSHTPITYFVEPPPNTPNDVDK